MRGAIFASAFLLAPCWSAYGSIEEIKAVSDEIAAKNHDAAELWAQAQGNGPHWARLFSAALYHDPPLDAPFNNRSSSDYGYALSRRSDEDFVFDEWKQRREAQDARGGNYKSIIAGYKEEFQEVLKLMLADYHRAVEIQADITRLQQYKKWLLNQEPVPRPLTEGLSRASALLKAGRRREALAKIKGFEPYAPAWPPAEIALDMAAMIENDFRQERRASSNFYDAMEARDAAARYRELFWLHDCLWSQSRRFQDFLYPPENGRPAVSEEDAFIRGIGLDGSAEERVFLKTLLTGRKSFMEKAVAAARAKPACQTLRVAPDGSGDARNVQEAVAMMAPPSRGGTIIVEPGTYAEPVRISGAQRILIRSRERGKAVLAPPPGSNGVEIFQSAGVVLDGLAFDLQGKSHAVRSVASQAVTVKHCRIQGLPESGIRSEDSKDLYIWDCSFEGRQ